MCRGPGVKKPIQVQGVKGGVVQVVSKDAMVWRLSGGNTDDNYVEFVRKIKKEQQTRELCTTTAAGGQLHIMYKEFDGHVLADVYGGLKK